MPEFVDLKRKLTEDQRSLLTQIWVHYLEKGQWILRRKLRYLYRNLGKEGVETGFQNPLGGTVVHEVRENGLEKYRLTILGVLLSDRGEEAENLLARYLGYVRNEFQRIPTSLRLRMGTPRLH